MNVITDDDDGAPASEGSDGNADGGSSSQDRIIGSIYRHLVQSVCVDVAATMHRLLKTGDAQQFLSPMTAPVIATRRDLYPELYGGPAAGGESTKPATMTEEEIAALLDRYGVDHPADGNRRRQQNTSSCNMTSRPGGRKRRNDSPGEEHADNGKSNDYVERAASRADSKKKNGSKKGRDRDASTADDAMMDDNDDNDDNEDDDDRDEDFKMEDLEEENDDDDDVPSKEKRGTKAGTPAPATTSNGSNGTASAVDPITGKPPLSSAAATNQTTMDIWGKYPPKEPKDLMVECRLCGRQVSTSRFANHLDKCMGLSTRPFAGAANRGQG